MDESEFNMKVLKAEKPVVIDFWAPWCMPCKITKPLLERLAKTYAGRVDFIAINADDSPELVKKLGIMGIPSVLTFQGGVETSRHTGAQGESYYASMFESLATGKLIEQSQPMFDRLLKLGAGALFFVVGISTNSWLLVGVGLLISFLGVYDRCPIWKTVTGFLARRIAH